MIILDYVLLAILAYFAVWGLRKGLIRAIGSIFGLIIAIIFASRYYEQVAEFISSHVGGISGNYNLIRFIAFIGSLFVINRIVLLAVVIVEKMYSAIAVVPFMKLANRLLGAVLGLIEGCIILGLLIYFASKFPFGSVVQTFLDGSTIAPIVLSISTIVQPLLPNALTSIQGLF